MAYIETHQSLRDHKKILQLAAELDMPEPHVTGHCVYLWLWSIDNAPDGLLPSIRIIERAAAWTGESGEFVEAMLTVGMLERNEDDQLVIHDWYDYAGRLIDKRKENAQRMRSARARKKTERAPHVQRTSSARAGATVSNRTVPNQEIISSNVTQVPECDREEPENLVPSPSQTPNMDHAGQEVEIRMMQHLSRQFIVKANDFTELKKLLASQVPLEFILTGIDRAFERNPGISSFAYCAKVIADLWSLELAKQANVTPIDFAGRGSRDGPDGARVSKGLPEEAEVFKRYVDAACDTS